MYCKKCGKQIADDSRFCPDCGTKVGENEGKSRLAAGLFGIFFGVYGVHNFYLGNTNTAIVQLVLGLLVVTAPVSALWGLVEGIMILAKSINYDGEGKPLKNDI